MSGITPPLTHIQCNPSSFLLSAAYHVPVHLNSAEAGNGQAVVQEMWVKPCLRETQHTAITIFLCVFISAASSSVLLPRDLTLPMTTAGTAGLCLLLFALCFTPALQPHRNAKKLRKTWKPTGAAATGLRLVRRQEQSIQLKLVSITINLYQEYQLIKITI